MLGLRGKGVEKGGEGGVRVGVVALGLCGVFVVSGM